MYTLNLLHISLVICTVYPNKQYSSVFYNNLSVIKVSSVGLEKGQNNGLI